MYVAGLSTSVECLSNVLQRLSPTVLRPFNSPVNAFWSLFKALSVTFRTPFECRYCALLIDSTLPPITPHTSNNVYRGRHATSGDFFNHSQLIILPYAHDPQSEVIKLASMRACRWAVVFYIGLSCAYLWLTLACIGHVLDCILRILIFILLSYLSIHQTCACSNLSSLYSYLSIHQASMSVPGNLRSWRKQQWPT
jgi:hypothetical protein